MQILLAEDDPSDGDLTELAIRAAGLASQLARVHDGAAAIEWLQGTGAFASRRGEPPPRLIMTDLNMPKVDGLGVLKHVRSIPALRCVPVVLFTSSIDPREIAEAYQNGLNSYVVKPPDFVQYSASVEQILAYWLGLNL